MQAPAAIKQAFEGSLTRIGDALPSNTTMKPERIVRMALMEINSNADLMDCNTNSMIQSVMQAASLGLEVGGPRQLAYLIPYKQCCTLQVGYRGMVELARRSGEVAAVNAYLVRENDHFEVHQGTDPRIDHRPAYAAPDDEDGRVVAAYAVANLANGGTQFCVMSRKELEHIKSKSKQPGKAWTSDPGEMSKKAAVKRLCKLLPQSVELAEAIALDNHQERPDLSDLRVVAPPAQIVNAECEVTPEQSDTGDREADRAISRIMDAIDACQSIETLHAIAGELVSIPAGHPMIDDARAKYDAKKAALQEPVS